MKMTAFGMQHHTISLKQSDVSEVLTSFTTRAIIEAVRTSEMSVYFN
jgi:hypothetical protein